MIEIKTCEKCNPPRVEQATSDYWQCKNCFLKFHLDRDTSTWWPEAWWDERNTPPQPLEQNSNSDGEGQ